MTSTDKMRNETDAEIQKIIQKMDKLIDEMIKGITELGEVTKKMTEEIIQEDREWRRNMERMNCRWKI